MKLVYAGVVAAVAGTGLYLTTPQNPSIDPMVVSSTGVAVTGGERFALLARGADEGCRVTAVAGKERRKDLRLSPGCVVLVPALAGAKWWLERGDGSVAFMGADNRVLAEFATADGAALESYRPLDPVMTLLAL